MMTTSNYGSGTESLTDLALDITWGLWAELGVSGWRRTHGDWAIDPEPLLFFTAAIADLDPRLRDESLDWCIANWRQVSRIRLKSLVNRETDGARRIAWGEFAATVDEHSGAGWPGATEAIAGYRPTGKSTLRSFAAPALVGLRLRAMFGVSARAEILRDLLLGRSSQSTIAHLADATLYTKRNVAEACDALERAGVLTRRSQANRFSYALADRAALTGFVGELPSIRPHWFALFDVISQLVDLERRAASVPDEVRHVEMHTTMRAIEPDLDVLDLPGPGRAAELTYTEVFRPWSVQMLRGLAEGRGLAGENVGILP